MKLTNQSIVMLTGAALLGVAAGGFALTQSSQTTDAQTTLSSSQVVPTRTTKGQSVAHAQTIAPQQLATSKQPVSSASNSGDQLLGVTKNPLPKEATEQWTKEAARAQAQEKQAILLMEQGRFAEAEAACHRALAFSPKVNGKPFNMRALQLLGDVRFAQDDYQKAIETYDRAREHTRNLELDFSTALAYLKLGDLKSARKYFDRDRYYAVSKFSKSRRQTAAEKRAETVAKLPEDTTAKGFEANIYIARAGEKQSYADSEGALKAYQQALALFPHNNRAMDSSAMLLNRLKRYDEAIQMWARAAAFGTGKTAEEARFELRQRMTNEKAEQLTRETKKRG